MFAIYSHTASHCLRIANYSQRQNLKIVATPLWALKNIDEFVKPEDFPKVDFWEISSDEIPVVLGGSRKEKPHNDHCDANDDEDDDDEDDYDRW